MKYLIFALSGLIIVGSVFAVIKTRKNRIIDSISTVTDVDNQKQIEFRGWLTTIWGDGFNNGKTGKSVTIYTVSNGKQSYQLQTSSEMPSLLEFDRKEVLVIGITTEDPNIIKVISIKNTSP